MSQECPKCEEVIKREKEGITCEGGCGQLFHTVCVHLQANEIEIINNNENIQFICDVCQAFCLKTVNNKFDGVYEYLFKLDKRTQDILNLLKQKNEISNKEPTQVPNKQSEKKVGDGVSATQPSGLNTSKANGRKNENTDVRNTRVTRSTNNETPKVPLNKAGKKKTTTAAKTPAATPAEAASTSAAAKRDNNKTTKANKREERDDPRKQKTNTSKAKYAVVVRPKRTQNSIDTIKELNRKCDTNDLDLKNVTKTKSGLVIIDCETIEQQNEIKSRIEDNIGDSYEISDKAPLPPKIKIVGITEEMTVSEIEASLKRQNGFIAQGDIKVLKVAKDWKETNTFNAIVRVDCESYKQLMKRKKVLINWDSCMIKEHYSIVRCHKCSGFNHFKEECRNKVACGYCGKEHETSACDDDTTACINCIVANEKYGLQLDTNHNVWSPKCEILNKKIQRVSKRTERTE